jgi:hypothetical protein
MTHTRPHAKHQVHDVRLTGSPCLRPHFFRTGSNADAKSRAMRPVTRKLKKKNNRNIFFFPHTNFDYGRGLAVRFVS